MTVWIPASLRLPDTGMYGISDTVICAYTLGPDGPVYVGAARYHVRDGTWRVYGQNALHPAVVLAWQPLPEPPEEP